MFKVGDKVRIKDNEKSYGGFYSGRIGTVTDPDRKMTMVASSEDLPQHYAGEKGFEERTNDFHLMFNNFDLEPYVEKTVFKVGDKVRIKDGSYFGEVLEVTEVNAQWHSQWPIHTTAPQGERAPWRWDEDELELVEEVTDFDVNEMFDAYRAAGVDISVTIDGKVYTGTVYPSSKDEDWGYLHGYDEYGDNI